MKLYRIKKANMADVSKIRYFMDLLILPNIECYWCDISYIRNHIKKRNVYLLRYEDTIIGCMILVNNGDYLQIETLSIDPLFRGLGYGKMLVNFAKRRMVTWNLKKIVLFSMLQYKATNFYKKMGFDRIGRSYFCKRSFNIFELERK